MSNDPNKGETAIFNQPGWTVRGDVYNVSGNLILSKDSKISDFITALEDLKQQIHELKSLDQSQREQLLADVHQVVLEVEHDKPKKNNIVSRLNVVKDTLESLRNIVKGSFDISKTVGQMAAWAAGFFV